MTGGFRSYGASGSKYYVSSTNPSGESLHCLEDSPHSRHEWREYPTSEFQVTCPGVQDIEKRKKEKV